MGNVSVFLQVGEGQIEIQIDGCTVVSDPTIGIRVRLTAIGTWYIDRSWVYTHVVCVWCGIDR